MAVLGPNCYGFINYLDNVALWPDQHGGQPVKRGVALVTQSSNIAINLTMQRRGVPLAYVVTVGNQAQVGLSAVSEVLLADDRVTALGLHIEGIDDLRAFEALAARAHAAGKPIVALKIGRSEQAQAATISHTASLAGSDAGAQALLSRLGIGQVSTLPALLETLKLLHVTGPLTSNRIASLSCSGGEASLIADMAVSHDLEFPPLSVAQKEGLRSALGPGVALANPLDYHTYIWGNEDAVTSTCTAMMQGDIALGCMVLDLPREDRCDPAAWSHVMAAVARCSSDTGKPMAIVSSLPENLPEDIASSLIGEGIVPLYGIESALAAIEVAAQLGEESRAADPILVPSSSIQGKILTEAASKEALERSGLDTPRALRVQGAKAVAAAASEIGFPVVLKGEGIAHKTEHGAVVLNLSSPQSVLSAASTMPTDKFLVEEMIDGALAELLIGVVADPAHGYVLTLGAGGTLTEVMHDTTSLLVPSSRKDVLKALKRLRIAKVLSGYRAQQAANIEAILDAIMAVQTYVEEHRPLEVEINPLLCGPERAIAADALIRTGD
jgi:acyl-CoA synthetase (NDP forming)